MGRRYEATFDDTVTTIAATTSGTIEAFGNACDDRGLQNGALPGQASGRIYAVGFHINHIITATEDLMNDAAIWLSLGYCVWKVGGQELARGPLRAFPDDGLQIATSGQVSVAADCMYPNNGGASRALAVDMPIGPSEVISCDLYYPSTARSANTLINVSFRAVVEEE